MKIEIVKDLREPEAGLDFDAGQTLDVSPVIANALIARGAAVALSVDTEAETDTEHDGDA